MSKKDFGGMITMKLSTGQVFSLRGTCTIFPARRSVEAITNQDGSIDRVSTPVPARFEINFADRGIDYDALLKSDRFNTTFDEGDNDVTHYFTSAFMTGEPQVNRANGEVTGLAGASPAYTRRG